MSQPPCSPPQHNHSVLRFHNVSFNYPNGKIGLKDANFTLERGKTYALVGPTGGGKTTTASLMARLYDPSAGKILLEGCDIRSLQPEDRARKIGFVLQEPILFAGTLLDNLFYGNTTYAGCSPDELRTAIRNEKLEELLRVFGTQMDTVVQENGENLSLGQRQIVAFARAVLRRPEIFILDEATANIDTVTEQLLQEILQKLPCNTTKIIIAHRFKTIQNADVIFFVNAGEITHAGSFQHALEMLGVK